MKKIIYTGLLMYTVLAGAVSPSAFFADKMHAHVVPLKNSGEAIEYLLELWTVFDLLRSIRLTQGEGVSIARELLAPIAVFDMVIVQSCSYLKDDQDILIGLLREVQQVFDCVFEHIPEPEVFMVESLLEHVAESLLLETPAVFNNE